METVASLMVGSNSKRGSSKWCGKLREESKTFFASLRQSLT